jgi:hypothetical protein
MKIIKVLNAFLEFIHDTYYSMFALTTLIYAHFIEDVLTRAVLLIVVALFFALHEAYGGRHR